MPRKRDDWIEGYLEYTDGIESPVIYRRWAAICAVSAALMRRVCTTMKNQTQFPNLYILLCSSPATGKSNAIKTIKEHIIKEEPLGSSIILAPDICTRASFFDEMSKKNYSARIDGSVETINACSIFADEWAQFMPEKDTGFMGQLSDLYDNPGPRSYVTISRKDQKLEAASVNMIGGCTPLQLRLRISEKELEGGFASRIIFITSNTRVKVPLGLETYDPDSPEEDDDVEVDYETQSNFLKRTRGPIQHALIHDLESVLHIQGRYRWHPEARDMAVTWDDNMMPPIPTDPKLEHYLGRRPSHFIKLCMVYAAARRDQRRIKPEDVISAKETLLEAEGTMPTCVHSIAVSDHYQIVVKAAMRIHEIYQRTGQPVPEAAIRREVVSQVPLLVVNSIFENLVRSGFARNVAGTEEGIAPLYVVGEHYDELIKV